MKLPRLKALANFMLGGKPPEKPVVRPVMQKPLPDVLRYPVLFANGRDDDAPAVKAFFEGKPYILDGRVCHSGDKPAILRDFSLSLSCTGIIFMREGFLCGIAGELGTAMVVDMPFEAVRVIRDSRITFGISVQP